MHDANLENIDNFAPHGWEHGSNPGFMIRPRSTILDSLVGLQDCVTILETSKLSQGYNLIAISTCYAGTNISQCSHPSSSWETCVSTKQLQHPPLLLLLPLHYLQLLRSTRLLRCSAHPTPAPIRRHKKGHKLKPHATHGPRGTEDYHYTHPIACQHQKRVVWC